MSGERYRFAPDSFGAGGTAPREHLPMSNEPAHIGSELDVGDAESSRELLVNRLIEGRAGPGDWLDLRDTVAADPRLWEHLAGVQADAASLGALGALAEATVGAMPLPSASAAAGRLVVHAGNAGRPTSRRVVSRWRHLAGWAVAACLAVALGVMQFTAVRGGRSGQPIQGAGLAGGLAGGLSTAPAVPVVGEPADPESALAQYVELGQQAGSVLGELPARYVVQTRPTADGSGTEVLYVRQILERAVVGETFRVGTDELGRRVLVPASIPMRSAPAAY